MAGMESQYHIGLTADHLAGNGGMGRYVFLPGDRSRAARIAERFEEPEHLSNPRGHDSYLGRLRPSDGGPVVDVLAISSGMGTPSTEIIASELLDCGARRVVRVGSSAAMHDSVPPGSVLVVSGAVRDESTSDRWTPQAFPAISHPDAVSAMNAGAIAAGLADQTFVGLCHSKDSLFGREFARGPLALSNRQYVEALESAGVLATEMEASLLFVLASVASAGPAHPLSAGPSSVPVAAACVLAIYGEAGSEASRVADQRAITVACEGVLAWARQDGQGGTSEHL
jgi:uridine phosphorylase